MRGLVSVALVIALAVPVAPATASEMGTFAGQVSVDGRLLRGLQLSIVDVQQGRVYRAVTNENGEFLLNVPPGSYVIASGANSGLAISKGPALVQVAAGAVADAKLEVTAIAAALIQDAPAAPAATEAGQVPPPDTPVAATTIQHDPVGCLIAGQFPMLDASIQPPGSVQRARLYFKSALSEFFYSEMQPLGGGAFRGFMPKPTEAASPITYYIEATTTEFGEAKTQEITAIVVTTEDECPDNLKVAPIGTPPPGLAFFSATTGALALPAGFAAGGVAAGLGAAAIIALAGGAIAAVTAVVVTNTDSSPSPSPFVPPASPSPSPSPLPVPSPSPSATPPPAPTSPFQ